MLSNYHIIKKLKLNKTEPDVYLLHLDYESITMTVWDIYYI